MSPNQRAAWIVRAGKAGENQADLFRESGAVILGFGPAGDLTGKSRNEIADAIAAGYPDRSEQTRGTFLYQLDAFVNTMKPGDIVLIPVGRGSPDLLGEITGLYEYTREPVVFDWHHVRTVDWVRTVSTAELPEAAQRAQGSIRTITEIKEDVAVLERLLAAGSADVIHLLLKWRVSEEPPTIDLHREIADRLGSVWWGEIGDPPDRSAMSETFLERFRQQLTDGVTTHVYLYRPGGVWRANLLDITLDEEAIDRSLVPEYYGTNPHNLWVRLDHLTALPAEWVLNNLAPAGDRASQRMDTFLSSRGSVLYVRELNREAQLEPITWWVNQGQTYLQERDGGYMWAPRRSKGAGVGPRPYWTTMTRVRSGDRIAHYRNGAIRAVSRATSAAEDTTRPGELPAEAWEHEGWLVRTEYQELVNPLRLDAIPNVWLVPSSGPFNAVGRVQQGYLFKLSDDFGEELARMLSNAELAEPGSASGAEIEGDDALDALASHTLMDKTELEELIELLETRKQLILQGPPGCGKTWVADALARHLTDNPLDSAETNRRMELVQFHQSYGYEDFMQGIRPITTNDGRIEYHVLPGILMRFIEQQGPDPSDNYVLVIDEINRGNISRIFGELLLLLEYRDKEVRLPYSESKEPKFRLPKNLLIIGTMNTADRSLASIDYALRRRFAFQRLSPVERGKARVLARWLERHQSIPRPRRVEVLQLFLSLNRRVEDLMGAGGEDFQIGHSYFMTEQIFTERGRARVWRTSIRPLLEEYLANRKERTELLDQLEPAALLARPEEADELEGEIEEDAE